MTNIEKLQTIESLKEWEGILKEAEAQVEALKDALKAEMSKEDVSEMPVDKYIVRWTTVTTNRIDTGLLRKQNPELAAQYTKASTSRRFTVSG